MKSISIPIFVSAFSAVSFFSQAEPARNVYNLICTSDSCNAMGAVSKYITGNKQVFRAADTFYIYDSNVVVDSITYSDYLSYLKKTNHLPPVVMQKDAALDCRFDTDNNCNDWKDSSDATSIVNYLQNYTFKSQPMSNIEVEIRTALKQMTNSVIVGAITAVQLHKVGGKITQLVLLQTGNKTLGLVVAGGITGGLSTAAGYIMSAQSIFKVGDVLVFKGGKLISVIRNGVEIPADKLTQASNGASGGGVDSGGGGTTGGGGIVGGGSSGGGGFGSGRGAINDNPVLKRKEQ